MLAIERKEGQWVEVTHKTGDKLFFRVYGFGFTEDGRPFIRLAFDDPPHNFAIDRPSHHDVPLTPPRRSLCPSPRATPLSIPRRGGLIDVRPDA